MRPRRLKLDSEQGIAYYHCISRTAGAEWLWQDGEKEVLRKQLWLVAAYCGVQIVTYALLSNHYHVLIRVPQRREVGDEELLHLYEQMYPGRKKFLDAVRADMSQNGELARRWREKQKRQMFDVSQFNKLLKMRFSIWYNRQNERKGTLWEGRFTSVLVQEGEALRKIAAYIDLNGVDAGLAEDPKDYRYCGYAEAVGGNEKAREGLQLAYGRPWAESEQSYRCLLYGTLAHRGRVDAERIRQVLKEQGKLSVHEVLRCRIRYFEEGLVLGTHDYVARISQALLENRPVRGVREPRALVPVTEWTDLRVLSPMRNKLFG